MRFHIAWIRFTPSGRLYPVNCSDRHISSGDLVIVRMLGHRKPLQSAEVAKIEWVSRTRAPKHSIVCRENAAQEYAGGPDEIVTSDDLHRFLLFLGWKQYGCLKSERLLNAFEEPTRPPARFEEWPIAYALGTPFDRDRRHLSLHTPFTIHVGPPGVGYLVWGGDQDDSIRVGLQRRRLILGEWDHVRRFEGLTNPYRQAAEMVERDAVIWSHDDSPDESLAQIRGAISPGGGPTYLGDDVWL